MSLPCRWVLPQCLLSGTRVHKARTRQAEAVAWFLYTLEVAFAAIAALVLTLLWTLALFSWPFLLLYLVCFPWPKKVAAWPTGVLAALLALALWLGLAAAIHWVGVGIKDRNFYGQFLQLCFSSWPNPRPESHTWWFAFGVSTRLTLVLGTLGGLLAVFRGMLQIRRALMRHVDLLNEHDVAVKAIFLLKVQRLARDDRVPRDANGMYQLLHASQSEAKANVMKEFPDMFDEKETE